MIHSRIIAAVAVEIAYAAFTRTWLPRHVQGVELELAVSACRLATAGMYWMLFRGLIRGRALRSDLLRSPLVLAAAALVLAIPFLFRGWDPGGGLGTAVVYALTSFIVGFREELLYRAVLISVLEPRIGRKGAIGLSTVVFLVYHYGALPLAVLPATEVVCMSLLLGIVYAHSGSLLFVTALHSLYDGIWFFGPYMTAPLPDIWRLAFLLGGLAFALLWASHMPDFRGGGRAEARRST